MSEDNIVGYSVMPRRCSAITRNGTPCRSPVVGASGYCVDHDPSRQAELAHWRAKGGSSKRWGVRLAKLLPPERVVVAERLLDLMARLERGEVEPAVATAAAALARAYLQTLGEADLAAELAELRHELAELRKEQGG